MEHTPPVAYPPHVDYAALKAENSALLREEIARRATVYRALPEVVTLNHTDICNLRCIMCPRHLAQGTHRLDRRVLAHVANQLFPTAKKLVLTTSGGEPLGADFDFLLEQALHYGVKVDAVTNGVLLTPALYRRARTALDHLNVSLDSHVPEVYERIRLGASHDRVFGNLWSICAIRREEPDDVLLSVSAVVMRSNLPHLDEFVRFAAGLGVDGVVLQRLAHETKPTPEEALEGAFSVEDVGKALDGAAAAARETGVNLFTSEFGRPNVMVAPIRAKVPPTVEGHGTCWFVAQDFGVMYTGEVYPCCIPTDHLLGNVLYQDPVEIWNGKPFQRLRAAQLSGRGTTFCSGCLHAPHLPPRRPQAINRIARKVRMAVAHVKNNAVRRYRERFGKVIFDPGEPDVVDVEGHFARQPERTRSRAAPLRADSLHVDAKQRMWWVENGALRRSDDIDARQETLAEAPDGQIGSAVCVLSPDNVLFALEGDGRLLRFDGERVSTVLEFPNRLSFVRQGGITVAEDGSVWVGEYGVFPGARCARVYRSRDGVRNFDLVKHFRSARHVHLVYALTSRGLVVTTGDLASERRMHVASAAGARFTTVRHAWSGFTAIAETNGIVHGGTDLKDSNGFVRFANGIDTTPEFRRLPADCDAPVRRLLAVDEHRLLAWCRVEDNPPLFGTEHWAALLLSEDAGASWSLIHRVFGGPDEVPESIELLSRDPLRVITVMGSAAAILEVA